MKIFLKKRVFPTSAKLKMIFPFLRNDKSWETNVKLKQKEVQIFQKYPVLKLYVYALH